MQVDSPELNICSGSSGLNWVYSPSKCGDIILMSDPFSCWVEGVGVGAGARWHNFPDTNSEEERMGVLVLTLKRATTDIHTHKLITDYQPQFNLLQQGFLLKRSCQNMVEAFPCEGSSTRGMWELPTRIWGGLQPHNLAVGYRMLAQLISTCCLQWPFIQQTGRERDDAISGFMPQRALLIINMSYVLFRNQCSCWRNIAM